MFGKKRRQPEPEVDNSTDITTEPITERYEATTTLEPQMPPEDAGAADGGESAPSCPKLTISRGQTIGHRKKQEDALCHSDWHNPDVLAARGLIAAVADGIGGLSNGDIASGAVVRCVYEGFMKQDNTASPSDRLLELAAAAQRELLDMNRQGAHTGSTLACVLIEGWRMWLMSIGDSRICLYRTGTLLMLNRPHVYQTEREQENALNGEVEDIDARKAKALTAYLGQEKLRYIDRTIQPINLISGDRVLLMSDGVFGTLSEDELLDALRQPAAAAAGAIIAAVEDKQALGQDNATAIVIGVE